MEPLWIIGIFVVSGIIFALQQQAVTAPGRALHKKFVELGNIQGKTKEEIIAKVGRPTSISAAGPDQTLLQWQATGCHMALLFTGEKCDGITHEHLQQS